MRRKNVLKKRGGEKNGNNGSNIIGLKHSSLESNYEMYFNYDEQGEIIGVSCEGKEYFYIRDITGNITKIVDENGSPVVSYTYDAWGNFKETINIQCLVAYNNPFVYKGYFFDSETGWFYLKSRYYDSTIRRFINEDDFSYLDSESLTGINLYSYCGNNPISNCDINGNKWYHWVIAAAIVITIAAALVISAGSATGAIIAVTQVAYGYAASTMATTVLATAFIGSTIALGSSVVIAAFDSSTLEEFAECGNWGTVAFTFCGALIGTAFGYLQFANYGWTQYGEKTPKDNYPFGRYYNTKQETITHYNYRCEMWWSKHLTNHGKPNTHTMVPHWHAELPHFPGGGFSAKELIIELLKRIFGKGNK